ncbi:MAG: glycoside hydrolase [Opitutus sp.]|nr:glycoside hydrolase [Opitutus sp.]
MSFVTRACERQRVERTRSPLAGARSCASRYLAGIALGLPVGVMPGAETFTNFVGMTLVRIEAGPFLMGNDGEIDYAQLPKAGSNMPGYRKKGDGNPPLAANPLEWDETPVHEVRITTPVYFAATPVTNAQFERFRPEHRALRGKQGFSRRDDEAVVFVSWHDAVAFCAWLGEREGRVYRLPTEAEWEWACRTGSSTAYNTGNTLPEAYQRHQVMDREHSLAPNQVSLMVGTTPPNAWGLHDMHGLVEEWCHDWYGPYEVEPAFDPVGREHGLARVTRGGSHSTGLPFLRSANRSAALPETRTFLIGFRVVSARLPATPTLPDGPAPRWAGDVGQTRAKANVADAAAPPIFLEPRTYTRIAADANGPLFITHSHCPSVTVCPNGDLLAVWFTTIVERGREMVIAGARLRHGRAQWDEPDIFFHVPDRNLTGSALWWDGGKRLYHANGVGVGDDYKNLALALRTSDDNGATWSAPRLIDAEHRPRNQVIDTFLRTRDGTLVIACDSTSEGAGGTAVHISRDDGLTWTDPGAGKAAPKFAEGERGAWIAGIHAGIVELRDGGWLALGRGNDIGGRMPMSVSADGGVTWSYTSSEFEPIGGAQRLELIRLAEGPLLLVTFAKKLPQRDVAGASFTGRGMFAALSFDEGRTWPIKKLVTPGDHRRVLDAPCNRRWGEAYSVLNREQAEARGYLTGVQSTDGMIHVLSSGTHYAFNLAWLKIPASVPLQ